jgi:hypothetical protein
VQRCGTGAACGCGLAPEVGQPGDVREQEADRTAERIVPGATPRGGAAGSAPSTASRTVQRSADPSSGGWGADRLGPGRPLTPGERSPFEAGLGADLSTVRVHNGEASDHAADSLQAAAFTVGGHIAFRAGRFAPGTLQGDRLLAHELTHVLQQRGGGPGASRVQRQTAPRGPGGTAPEAVPPMTGEQVQFSGVTLSENPAQLRHVMEQLILTGRPMPMGNSLPPGLSSLQSFRSELNRFTFAHMSDESICREQPADDRQCRLALKIRPVLDPILDQLERECIAEVDAFRTAARENTVRTLDASERQARAELVRYGITEHQVQRTGTEFVVVSAGMDIVSEVPTTYTATEHRMSNRATPAVTGLQNAATVLLGRRQAIEKKQQEQVSHRYAGLSRLSWLARIVAPAVPMPDERYFELGREITEMRKRYDELQDVLAVQYPALAAVSEFEQSPEGLRTLAAGASPEMAALIAARVGSTLANIAKVRGGLWDDVNVWRLPDIMALTKAQLGVRPGTLRAALVDEKIQFEQPGLLNDLVVMVLNVAALLLAGPTGGLSLAAAGAMNIALAKVHVEEYLMAKALHGSALDQAAALSQEDPSLFWLAVEIVGVGLGDVPAVAGAGFRAFRLLRPVARAALVAEEGPQAARALGELRLTAQEVREAALADNVVLPENLADNLVARVGELRGGRATAMGAMHVEPAEAALLGAGARAVESEAAQTIGHAASAAGESRVTVSRAGWLFDCASPCTIIRERYAGVLGGDPARLAELAELEQRALTAAASLDAARAADPLGQAAREAERVASQVSDDAAAFVRRVHEAYPHTRPSLALTAKVADARAAFGSVLARRPALAEELAELERTASAASVDPSVVTRIDELQVRLAQLHEVDSVSQVPHNARIVEVSADRAAANFYETVAGTVPDPPVVLEFPDGSRAWRETAGGPIRHEATLGESAGRAGMERGKYTATAHGNLPPGPKYERAHALGQGTGFESPYAIYYAPEYVNQTLQNRGIEAYMRELAASAAPGESFRVVTRSTAHPRTLRLATMDYTIVRVTGGQVEEVATYSIRVTASKAHPRVTADALRFSPTAAGQAVAGRVPLPDLLTAPASFTY